jgi:hypothetical protein
LTSLLKHCCEALVKLSRELSVASLLEFGQSLSLLGASEGESLGAALQQVEFISLHYYYLFYNYYLFLIII